MRRLLVLTAVSLALAGNAGQAVAQSASAPTGETVYRRACAACHATDPGVNRSGPSLAGVSGRAAGAVRGFRYSDAMASSTVTWTDAQLDAFLINPRAAMPGNRMVYAGLSSARDRASLIQYLRTLR